MPHKNNKHLHMKEEKPIKSYGYENQLDEIKILESYEQVVGKMIAKHTKDVKLKDGKLILKLDSAALKQELNYAKTTLISNLNKSVQKNIVKEIIIQ